MVRLVCYNIEYCEGLVGKWYDYFKLWKIFFPPKNVDNNIICSLNKLKPDILALIEVDTGSFRSKKDEVLYFKDNLNMRSFVEKIKYPLKGWIRLFHYIPVLNKQANAIISQYNIKNVKYHVLNKGTKREVIEAVIHCPNKLSLLLAHLALTKKARKKQIEELIGIVNGIKGPVILMGDFNTFHGKEEIDTLLKQTHLTDKSSLSNKKLTHPTWNPKKRLDYILTSEDIDVKKYKVLKFPFSDHLPVLIEFNVK